MPKYGYLKRFFQVFEHGEGSGRSEGASVACKDLAGLKFQVLKVIRKGSEGPEDPPEDMFLCRFETDFEMACWREEVVATINGSRLVVKEGNRTVRIGHQSFRQKA